MDKWFKRIALAFAILFLALCCLLMWRLTVFVARVDQTLEALNATSAQVSTAITQMSGELERLRAGLNKLEETGGRYLNTARASKLAGATSALVKRFTGSSHEAAENAGAEIAHLLAYVEESNLRYDCAGNERSAAQMREELTKSYASLKQDVETAEEFLARACDTCDALLDGGERKPLRDFLTQELDAYRAAQPAPPAETSDSP